jgi:hypothetical protein
MRTRDVPHDQWKPFLDGFASRHHGDPLLIETVGGGEGPKSILCGSPLVGIAADVEDHCINVKTGAVADAQTHHIGHPMHLSVSETDDGNPLGLQITAEDGSVTCLRFDHPEHSDKPPGNYLG